MKKLQFISAISLFAILFSIPFLAHAQWYPGPVNPVPGSFTTLSSSGTVSGAGFTNYFASPPPLGNVTPSTVAATTVSTTLDSYVSGIGTGSTINEALFQVGLSGNLSGVAQYGVLAIPTCTTAATADCIGVGVIPTLAPSEAVTSAFGFQAGGLRMGAGASATNYSGLFINNNSNASNNYGVNSNIVAATGSWNFYAPGTAQNAMAGSLAVGSVTAPASTLSVTGTVGVTGAITSTDSTAPQFVFAPGTTTGCATNAFENAGGNLFIGIDNSVGGCLATAGNYGTVIYRPNGTAFSISRTSTVDLGISSTGGVTMPNLSASSSAATGSVCWTTGGNLTVDTTLACLSSTLRVKEHLTDLSGSLVDVMEMRPVSYDLKPEFNPEHLGRQVGLIAEEVQKIDPRLVGLRPDGTVAGVRYMQLTAVLVGAIQEQQRETVILYCLLALVTICSLIAFFRIHRKIHAYYGFITY